MWPASLTTAIGTATSRSILVTGRARLGLVIQGGTTFLRSRLAPHETVSQNRTLETVGPTTTSARPTFSTTRFRGCLVATPSRPEVNSGSSQSAALQEPELFTLASIQVRPA